MYLKLRELSVSLSRMVCLSVRGTGIIGKCYDDLLNDNRIIFVVSFRTELLAQDRCIL
jgi:hypothetical protein